MTLRIDISFTDHSHVIGRGGKNTREVMTRTGCHIHFPDSNKDANGAKSNQVGVFCYSFVYFLEYKTLFIFRLQLLVLYTKSKPQDIYFAYVSFYNFFAHFYRNHHQ